MRRNLNAKFQKWKALPQKKDIAVAFIPSTAMKEEGTGNR